jgi:hypothetical protein
MKDIPGLKRAAWKGKREKKKGGNCYLFPFPFLPSLIQESRFPRHCYRHPFMVLRPVRQWAAICG